MYTENILYKIIIVSGGYWVYTNLLINIKKYKYNTLILSNLLELWVKYYNLKLDL